MTETKYVNDRTEIEIDQISRERIANSIHEGTELYIDIREKFNETMNGHRGEITLLMQDLVKLVRYELENNVIDQHRLNRCLHLKEESRTESDDLMLANCNKVFEALAWVQTLAMLVIQPVVFSPETICGKKRAGNIAPVDDEDSLITAANSILERIDEIRDLNLPYIEIESLNSASGALQLIIRMHESRLKLAYMFDTDVFLPATGVLDRKNQEMESDDDIEQSE